MTGLQALLIGFSVVFSVAVIAFQLALLDARPRRSLGDRRGSASTAGKNQDAHDVRTRESLGADRRRQAPSPDGRGGFRLIGKFSREIKKGSASVA